MTLRVLIADDEAVARQRLRRLLASAPGVEILGEACDGVDALEKARALAPDVVLLDIQMPGLDGLDVARSLGGDVSVIFTTAHGQHAVAAFEAAAADYLLKPVRPERLLEALDRARARRAPRAADPAAPPRLCARRGDVLELLDPREVSRLHAEAGHVVLTLRGREYVLDDSLVTLEARLAPLGFARAHRSELVNLALVRALHRQDDQAILELADGQRASVSRTHLPEIRRRLGIG